MGKVAAEAAVAGQHAAPWVRRRPDGRGIAQIAFGPDAPFWSGLERALLSAADELVGGGVISQPTWERLAQDLDSQQLLDVIFTVGACGTLAWMMRSVELELDDAYREVIDGA